jgi:hypothetical protein
MCFQQGFAKEDDHLIHRASCGLVGRIYQVDGKDGMRGLPCAFMPAGLAALSGNSVPAKAAPKAVTRP